MAKLRFYLKEPNQENTTSLFFMFNYGAFEIINGKKRYRPLKYYINESIEPKHWNREEERARRTYIDVIIFFILSLIVFISLFFIQPISSVTTYQPQCYRNISTIDSSMY